MNELNLTPQYKAFLDAGAKRLNVSVEDLIARIVTATIDRYLYVEKIPNYKP